MNKKTIFAILGTMILLLVFAYVGFGQDKYLKKEYEVQQSVIKTFDLKGNDLKPLFMRDIYDDKIAQESSETRLKVANAIEILSKDNKLAEGDFKPMIFLKGDNKVLIAVKHPNNTITLTEFDISKEKPVKVDQQVKEVK